MKSPNKFIIGVIILLTIINIVIMVNTHYAGDDWGYKGVFEGPAFYTPSYKAYPFWCHYHWRLVNGRMANFIAPLCLNLPKIVLGTLCGLVIGFLCYNIVTKSKSQNNPLLAMIILLTAMWGFSWWDSLYLFDIHFNYVWTSLFILLAIGYILSNKRYGKKETFFITILTLLAGHFHEAASLPICCSLCAYYLLNRKLWPQGRQWWPIIGFIIGTALVVFSPGLWGRADRGHVPNDPLLILLLKSDAIVLLMLLLIAGAMFRRSWRTTVLTELRGITGIFAIAAVLSMIISGISGIVGRSGWFAEIYALIAIARFINNHFTPVNNKVVAITSIILAILLLTQQSITAFWQIKMGRESDQFEEAFIKSSNGVVYQDVTYDNEIPGIVLSRVRGVPDADDFYLNYIHALYFRKPMVVALPTDAKETIENHTITDQITLHNGHIISRTPPHYDNAKLHVYTRDGQPWIVQEFEDSGIKYYYHSRRVHDPGDRDAESM
jgi:hypothetical protein